MEEIKDSQVHLIVTSPPYPMIKKWDSLFGTTNFEEQHQQLDKTWEESFRVLIDGGLCCINIGDATRNVDGNFTCYPNYARITMKMVTAGFTPLIPIFWKKISNRPNAFLGSGFLPPNAYVSQDCEYIGIYRKGKLRKFPAKDNNRNLSQYTRSERDLWFQQIWNIPGQKGAKQTSIFPKEIPFRLIKMFSLIDEIILDPFAGLGTTGIVAEELGRKFIGYELKESLFERD